MQKYKVIALCGSTKFKKEFELVARDLTLLGNIVLSLHIFSHEDKAILSEDEQNMLISMHRQKIDMSDEIYVIDVDGYIGKNTRQEIMYAESKNLPIKYYSKNYTEGTC